MKTESPKWRSGFGIIIAILLWFRAKAFTLIGAIVCLIVGVVMLVGLYMVVNKILSIIHRIAPAQAPDPPAQIVTNCEPNEIVALSGVEWFVIEAVQAAPRANPTWTLSYGNSLTQWSGGVEMEGTEAQVREWCMNLIRLELESGSTNECGFWKYSRP